MSVLVLSFGCILRVATSLEWFATWLVARDPESGLLSFDSIRAVYDHRLFEQLAAQHTERQAKKRKHAQSMVSERRGGTQQASANVRKNEHLRYTHMCVMSAPTVCWVRVTGPAARRVEPQRRGDRDPHMTLPHHRLIASLAAAECIFFFCCLMHLLLSLSSLRSPSVFSRCASVQRWCLTPPLVDVRPCADRRDDVGCCVRDCTSGETTNEGEPAHQSIGGGASHRMRGTDARRGRDECTIAAQRPAAALHLHARCACILYTLSIQMHS
jgi:hypothetical protein